MAETNPSPEEIRACVLTGDAERAGLYAQSSLAAGIPPRQAFEPFVKAIREAGDLFEQGEFFLPQLLLSAKAMQAALEVIFPDTGAGGDRSFRGIVVAGTVQGDIHVIGKNLVCALLSANGFKVIDLGADVSCERFLEATQQHHPDFLVLSSLLTTTMAQQIEMIKALQGAGLRSSVRVLVGGAPVTPRWAEEIGADGYAPDAPRAVDLALRLLEKSHA